jgi:hypothetical protein
MVQQFSSIMPSIGSHGLDLVARFVAKNFAPSCPISFSYVHPLS